MRNLLKKKGTGQPSVPPAVVFSYTPKWCWCTFKYRTGVCCNGKRRNGAYRAVGDSAGAEWRGASPVDLTMHRGAETSGLDCGELFFLIWLISHSILHRWASGVCVHVYVLVASTCHYRPIPHRFCQSTRPEGAGQIIYRIYSRKCAISSSVVKVFAQLNLRGNYAEILSEHSRCSIRCGTNCISASRR